MGKRKKKKITVRIIFGTKRPNISAILNHSFSIFKLIKFEASPKQEIKTEEYKAHW